MSFSFISKNLASFAQQAKNIFGIFFLLKEDGFYLLLEDGGKIILEESSTYAYQTKDSETYSLVTKNIT